MGKNRPKPLSKENEHVLANIVRKEIGANTNMREAARTLVKYFVARYEEAYDEILPLNRARAVMYLKRALIWCGGDNEEVEKIIDFLIGNWSRIKDELDLNGRPTVNLLGSANLFHRIRSLRNDGFQKTGRVKSRYVEDESPHEGW